jgi:hypothetical protein
MDIENDIPKYKKRNLSNLSLLQNQNISMSIIFAIIKCCLIKLKKDMIRNLYLLLGKVKIKNEIDYSYRKVEWK